MIRAAFLCILLALSIAPAAPARAGEVRIAVAANFAEPLEEIAAGFEAATGHGTRISTGSTGKLYAQIVAGLPVDVFLAADAARPERLVAEGRATGRFTYAIGRLTLWSADPARVTGPESLQDPGIRFHAIASPDLAPYGAAAAEVIAALGAPPSQRVTAENIGQAFAMVSLGTAEIGFVALSQVLSPRNEQPGSRWDVPPEMHSPIRQDAVLLSDEPAAQAFLDWLRGPEARAVIARYGYLVDETGQ